ncbi:MAG: Farnesyl diphosphate synthase [Firmicutes bacterium ADurb.Bin300]|nr:MAG: Farnesyl diphosphate synthase [Firmicutes bacterium ADurb.Bin300]
MNFNVYSDLINKTLDNAPDFGGDASDTVGQAMRYSLSAGGKRVRPLLTLLFCEACGGKKEAALFPALAIEYIHTYSLIHDDLPCMDNDDFRRGKLSCHKQFGESTALLAGDALLTFSFEKVARGFEKGDYDAETAVKIISVLCRSAGFKGMICGQAVDLSNEGKSPDYNTLKKMDLLKTGELMKAACVSGCLVANAQNNLIDAASAFGEKIGLAFQIQDDILDVTSDFSILGKLTGSDEHKNKLTYVKLLGLDECRRYADTLTEEALGLLYAFPHKREELSHIALALAKREK